MILTPSKEFDPQQSATWLVLQETEPQQDQDKVKNYSSMKEHDPVFSDVYQTPPLDVLIQRKSMSPQPPSLRGRSPVADFLPPHLRGAPTISNVEDEVTQSATQAAALADSPPLSDIDSKEPIKIPMYEVS